MPERVLDDLTFRVATERAKIVEERLRIILRPKLVPHAEAYVELMLDEMYQDEALADLRRELGGGGDG